MEESICGHLLRTGCEGRELLRCELLRIAHFDGAFRLNEFLPYELRCSRTVYALLIHEEGNNTLVCIIFAKRDFP